jgi:N-acetylglucosaminyldiphosphoundecaprenol N-acetyl-beta-D-mannosaminyltransferase
MLSSSERIARANVLGVGIHAVDMDTAVAVIERSVHSNKKGYVCVAGVHGVMEAQRDRAVASILLNALLVVPDGMPTVWVGRWQGLSKMQRVYGPDLMLRIFQRSAVNGFSHFFCGGDYGVAEQLRCNLQSQFPDAQIVGSYRPPFRKLTSREETELLRITEHLRPDITWVGLSTPKQEQFMAEYLPRMNTRLMIGVGAAFDYHTGRLKDSSQWIKQAGLQWLHRLAQDPARLWKRYLRNNPEFIALLALQLSGVKKYPLPVVADQAATSDFLIGA